MMEINRILCPVDFSDYSAAALNVAGEVAKAFGARVTVLHTQRLEAPVYFTLAQTEALRGQLRLSERAARKFTEKFASQHLNPSLVESVKVIEGDAVDIILREAEKLNADLVAMGTHGRTGLVRIRLGSVAESVLRLAHRPILTVGPNGLKAALSGAIKKVLCPVDFGELSHLALGFAAAIAEKTGAQLTVGHVQADGAAEDAKRTRQRLCDWVPAEMRGRCSVEEVVRQGRAAEQIVLEAEKSKAGLLVIGARLRHDLGSLLFGSTTESVIRSAPCPVLSIIEKGKSA